MHKLTVSNLSFKDDKNVLKLFSDNDFSNMIDSMQIFIQPQKLDELFQKRVNKIPKDYIKDEYNQLVKNVLLEEFKFNNEIPYKYLFIKHYKSSDINVNDFIPIFTLTPDVLSDFFKNMKIDKYQSYYYNTNWKLKKFGVFDLDWK